MQVIGLTLGVDNSHNLCIVLKIINMFFVLVFIA